MKSKNRVLWVVTLLAVAFADSARVMAQSGDAPQAGATGEIPVARQDEVRERPGRGRGAFGKITAIQSDSIEVTRPDGSKVSVKLNSSTQYRKDRETAKFSDFKVGDAVMVRTDQDAGGSSVATALMVVGGSGGPSGMMGTMGKDFVAGEVKSVDPPKLVVQRMDNLTQTLELNEETSLRRGRDSITMADIQPGDHIFARGAVSGDAFVPKSLTVVPPEMWKHMQEMNSGDGAKERPGPNSSPAPSPSGQNPPEHQR